MKYLKHISGINNAIMQRNTNFFQFKTLLTIWDEFIPQIIEKRELNFEHNIIN